jgi:hypothetical protein
MRFAGKGQVAAKDFKDPFFVDGGAHCLLSATLGASMPVKDGSLSSLARSRVQMRNSTTH